MDYKNLLIIVLIFMGFNLFGQSVDLQFVPSENSTETTYCINIQINGQNGADYIGISTIRFGYDPAVIRFNGNTEDIFQGGYTSLNFDSDQQDLHPGCETPFGFNPYSSHSIDGLAPGDIMLTTVLLNPTPPSGAPIFACPTIENVWIDVSEVCFEVLDPFNDPDLHFVGVEQGDSNGETTGTNFNSHFNNPNEKYLNGVFNPFNTPFADFVDDSVVICIFENPLDLIWIQDLIATGTPCEVDQINMFEFEDDTYFEVIPNFGDTILPCPADLPTNYYDCEGTFVCAIGNFPPGQFECPDGLTDAAANNGANIFQYLTGCTDECALNYNMDATEDDGSCEYPDCDDGCPLTLDSYDGINCVCINEAPDVDDGCIFTIDSFDETTCMIINTPDVDDGCPLTIDSFSLASCFVFNIIPDCDDNEAATTDTFDPLNCECINALDCPISDFDFSATTLELLCSGDTPTFPLNMLDFTISDPEGTQIGTVVWYNGIDPLINDVATEQPQTQIGCDPSATTTVYAFIGCDADSDGEIDEYVQVAQHQYQTYPEMQVPTVSGAIIDSLSGTCSYAVTPACPNDVLNITGFALSPGDGAGTIPIIVNPDFAGSPCAVQEFELAYEGCDGIEGCTDPCAANYDPSANIDDGSCEEFGSACTDPLACNYDSNADPDCGIGNCEYPAIGCDCDAVLGCTDQTACNFDVAATCDDGSCLENDCEGICGGPAVAGFPCDDGDPSTIGETWDINCVCAGEALQGCTDSCAPNYDPFAIEDDGSCDPYDDTCDSDFCTNGGIFIWDANTCECVFSIPTVSGCTDADACNFDPNANCDDGSCTVNDCEGVCGGSNVPGSPCDDGDPNTSGEIWTNDCMCSDGLLAGCTDPCAPNYDFDAVIDDGSCDPYDQLCDVDICTNGGIFIWDANTCECVLEIATILGCTDAAACNYDPNANCADGSCADNDCLGECGGTVIPGSPCDDGDPSTTGEVWTINCQCIGDALQGCTDPCADNFDPNAVIDDGSCDPYDDTCDFDVCTNGGTYIWDANTCECVLEIATILGCTDANACNYDPNANCDDNSCLENDCLGECGGTAIVGSPCDDGNPSTTGEVWTINCECIGEGIQGCTDPCADNYNPEATEDDGSCNTYNITCDTDVCTNGGIYIWDAETCSCILETATVLGCTGVTACNYDATANCDDNSCDFGNTNCDDTCNAILGCMDPEAENYDPDANCDFGIDCIMVSIETIVFEPISIFPNPARDFVTFRFERLEQTTTLYFYNIIGKMVKMENLESGTQEQTIFIEDLPSGIYLWEVNGVGGKLMVK